MWASGCWPRKESSITFVKFGGFARVRPLIRTANTAYASTRCKYLRQYISTPPKLAYGCLGTNPERVSGLCSMSGRGYLDDQSQRRILTAKKHISHATLQHSFLMSLFEPMIPMAGGTVTRMRGSMSLHFASSPWPVTTFCEHVHSFSQSL